MSAIARPAAPLNPDRLAARREQPESDGPVLRRFSCGTDSQPGQPEAGWEELVWEEGEHHCRSAYASVVRQLGPTRFAVDWRRDTQDEKQARIDRYCLAREVRIVPNCRDGLCHGFKLFSIKPGSLTYQLGLRSGDIVRRINGKNLDSPEKVLELYAQLKDASRIALLLEREGKALRHSYLIQR